ncbi:hypothetical protein ACFLZT_04785 [Thermodesulfobacteriota bacterium]
MRTEKRLIIFSIIGTGISSIAVQLITVREFLTQFHGNEITISLVLFSWLLVTGIGSLAARFMKSSSMTLYSLLLLLTALWPLPQMVLIRGMRGAFFIHGVSPGFYGIFLHVVLTTAPYCLLVGFLLPHSLYVLKENHHQFTSGELYLTDSIGDILGGAIFSFILVYWLTPLKVIAVTSVLLIFAALLIQISSRRYLVMTCSVILSVLFYGYSLNRDFETSLLTAQYGDIVHYSESPYGRIVVTQEGPQNTFWESGLPLYSNANVVNSEEKVHYPLSQLDQVGNILLVSGGLGETLNEILKYNPGQIDYVELDPYLTNAALSIGFLSEHPRLNIINGDARGYIKNLEGKRYDAIIIDLPEPDTFQVNRFFTSEFFHMAKRVLNSEGTLSYGFKYSPNYISGIRKKKLSTIYNTASLYFQNVLMLPGEKAYFICRDSELSSDIVGKLEKKSIETSYIRDFYQGNVTDERIKKLQDSIDNSEYINTDFEPRMMNIVFQEWFTLHSASPRLFIVFLLILTSVYLIFMQREEYVLFSTGLVTMGVEMLIIFSFQVIYGYIYLKIGAIITVFLLGLLPGAAFGNIFKEAKNNALILSEVVLITLLLVFFIWVSFVKSELSQICFLLYCFIFSFFCGFQFPVATRMIGEKMSPAAGCLAADLSGAAVGTIITGTLLIPLWGIQSAIIFLVLVKISSSLIVFKKKQRYW